MAKVIFYEKPGCGGNARQRLLLVQSGHEVEVRNLLASPWTPETLRAFFGTRPVAQWFNAASPRVKSGDVKPADMSDDVALSMMIADPLLIRRLLLQVGSRREVGFDTEMIDAWIGLMPVVIPVTEGCLNDHPPGKAASCALPPSSD